MEYHDSSSDPRRDNGPGYASVKMYMPYRQIVIWAWCLLGLLLLEGKSLALNISKDKGSTFPSQDAGT